MSLYAKSATELLELMQTGQCSSREVVDSVYRRIDEVEETVGSYITLTRQQAEEQAEQVDRQRAAKESIGMLAGIPIAVKDNLCTADAATTCGSKMLQNYQPPYNAGVVEKVHQAGAVVVGKTNMDELAMGSTGESSYFKVTRNPHNLERVPGGSSSGSAAALAAGQTVLALGSDTGGSVRLPAAYCGVVGLRPTYGSVSRYGAVAFASSLDQVGPMARCVEDTALLYAAICGRDERDGTSVQRQYVPFAQRLAGGVAGKIIGVPKEYFGAGIEPEVAQAVRAAVQQLEGQGAKVQEVSLPSTQHGLSAYYILACAEASSNLARLDGIRFGYRAEDCTSLDEVYERSRSEAFGSEVKRRIMLGTTVLSAGHFDAYYHRAMGMREQVRREFAEVFAQCDLLIAPTTPHTAQPLGSHGQDPVKMYAMDICNVPASLAGLPSISVPCGKDSQGMPIGMQLMGPAFSEETLFQVAYHYQQLVGGFGPLPACGQQEGVQ